MVKRHVMAALLVTGMMAGMARGEVWEYAELAVMGNGAMLVTPEKRMEEKGAYALYKNLGGTREKGEFSPVDLLNLLGKERWELVSVTNVATVGMDYVFKRKVGG